jgi:hypothetical protein
MWKAIYQKKIVKRKKDGFCKICKKIITPGDYAVVLNLTTGHDLPDDHFDIHFEGCIGIYHIECADIQIQQDDTGFEIVVEEIKKPQKK